jgi:hypothetical protein
LFPTTKHSKYRFYLFLYSKYVWFWNYALVIAFLLNAISVEEVCINFRFVLQFCRYYSTILKYYVIILLIFAVYCKVKITTFCYITISLLLYTILLSLTFLLGLSTKSSQSVQYLNTKIEEMENNSVKTNRQKEFLQ